MLKFRSILGLVTIGCLAFTAGAKESELNFPTPNTPQAEALLSPPPQLGSPEQAADLETVHRVYQAASESDKQAAYDEKKFSVFNFTTAVGPWFTATNLPLTTAFFEKVQLDAETVTDLGKDHFKRPRPFMTDPSLVNGSKLEKSFSYPSGHSTESMVLALVLADLLPEKQEAIIAHARQMGWHRVQIARHYPSDILAGRTLAQNIAHGFRGNAEFEKEFAAAKAEIAAIQAAAKN